MSEEQELEVSESPKRPTSITVLAWFLIVTSLLQLLGAVIGFGALSVFHSIWSIIVKSCALASGVGLLMMRRWSIILYFSIFALSIVVLLVNPPNQEFAESVRQPLVIGMLFIIPCIIAAITLPKWKLMK